MGGGAVAGAIGTFQFGPSGSAFLPLPVFGDLPNVRWWVNCRYVIDGMLASWLAADQTTRIGALQTIGLARFRYIT
jgi:hypothetical protein